MRRSLRYHVLDFSIDWSLTDALPPFSDVISGENGTAICIEPPRNRRASWADYPPYEIRDGNTLCFGQSTQFRVLNVHS